jgi:imidazolonepropionase-like amidohydrolase
MRVVGHVSDRVGLRHALASGQASIEHLQGYLTALVPNGAPPPAVGTYTERMMHAAGHADEAKISEVVEWTCQAGAWNCVTLLVGVKMGAARLSFDDEKRRPELRYISPEYLTRWDPRNDFRQQAPIDPGRAASAFARARELRGKLVRALRDAGARILLGTDTPNPFVIPGFSIHDELSLLVEAGLTPYEAIRAGTRDAAEFLGGQNEFGTVAVGLRADLILTEANPLDDVKNVARRAGVMICGRWLPAAELDTMLEDLAQATAQTAHRHD